MFGIGRAFKKVFGMYNDKRPAQAAEAEAKEAQLDAAAQLKKTNDAQAAYQQSMLNMQNNAATLESSNKMNLNTETLSNVVVAGTADETDLLKKKPLGAGIASQLGINV